MWNELVMNIVLSIIIILIGQYIWNYFRDNYTAEKTKNLVNIQAAKYKTIMEQLESSSDVREQRLTEDKNFLTEEDKEWLQKELDGFMTTIN
jgi:hypothetical protein